MQRADAVPLAAVEEREGDHPAAHQGALQQRAVRRHSRRRPLGTYVGGFVAKLGFRHLFGKLYEVLFTRVGIRDAGQ